MRGRDWLGLAGVALWLVALVAFRRVYVEPSAWLGTCTAPASPASCALRAALLWLEARSGWGLGALALGFWAFMGAPFWVRVAAVGLGAAAVALDNPVWGALGLALGAWAWIGRARAPEVADRSRRTD
ncbi:MAG: hypothetical protein FWD12_06520 [Alphaproteobacteria bacterium]|nr:hypothetical protein [Alphaproteobacteria bacterium]